MSDVFRPIETSLFDMLSAKYVIPVFQRPYSWESNEINELIDDLFMNFKKKDVSSNIEDYTLFIGTLYLRENNKISNRLTEYDVIDGQQRIATISLLLLSLIDYARSKKFCMDSLLEIRKLLWKEESRKVVKNLRLLELGNIDKDIWFKFFDHAYMDSSNLFEFSRKVDMENAVEKRIVNNYKVIHGRITDEFLFDEEKFLDFIDYLLYDVKCIVIYVNTGLRKLFEVFESINSKGRELEQIDLIKSYIFQNICEEDYDEYLQKWGELIAKTNDHLNDYLYMYIRAYIRYYKNSIKITNFKALSNYEMKRYFESSKSKSDVFKSLIDEMLEKVKFYRYFYEDSLMEKLLKDSESKYFFSALQFIGYEHPKPLLFRVISDEKYSNDLSLLKSIIKFSFKFMFSFQTLSGRESKNAMIPFETLLKNAYEENITVEFVYNTLETYLNQNSISKTSLENSILNHQGYNKRKETSIILSLYEFMDNKGRIDYDQAKFVIENRNIIQLDHIMPQNPQYDSGVNYMNHNGELSISSEHDFGDTIYQGMLYEDFKKLTLHRLGNIKLMWKKENQTKGNNIIKLKKYGVFSNYKQVTERVEDISKKIVQSILL